ncbi:MAG: 16S rRNA (cytidine(1402)-2'-O)-methyltransferase [Candidatus Neomarinimicrobiota bacterium]|nr:16S rRNA (cytidine(1402)-2'-O)-methyltransferase [Candidatus Neomarinimicrobiota bacterium]
MTNILGTLYIVSTPIGNLADITYRAVEILKTVDIIAAEDTRRSRILLSNYDIRTKMISYYEHNKYQKIQKITENLLSGHNVAIITDAGTPAISDPAYKLVRQAIKVGCNIESIPGPSAVLASLVSSGLPTDRFIFEGFLPPKKGRKKRLENLINESGTIIIYENTLRLNRTIKQILEIIGDRPAVICRELTKIHEEKIRGTLSSLLELLSSKKLKGECVLLIGKDDKNVYFE